METSQRHSGRGWLAVKMAALALAVVGSLALPAVFGRAQPAELRVDLSERVMRVMEGEEEARRYDVAVGRPGNPTPRGVYQTGRIVWNPGWIPPNSDWARGEKPRAAGDPKNPMQGVKIYFREPAYYIHGTNHPGSMGQAASRGCLRMRPSDATSLARWIESQGGSVRLVIKA